MKKNNLLFLIISLLTVVAFWSCRKEKNEINLNLTEVPALNAPVNGKAIKLNPASGQTEKFEWQQSKAEDGSLVLYEVLFDLETGDFSKPIAVMVSDNKGIENTLTLNHAQLNQLATAAGADFFQKKKVKWTVQASKGWNTKKATETRIIELERPGGFTTIPNDLYITGTATENGTDITKAIKMKKIGEGEFEVFTKLKAGSFKLVDATTGTPKEYYLKLNNNMLELNVNGTTEVVGADKVVWLKVNFNTISGSVTEVKKMEFWYCVENSAIFELPYVGNGVWRKSGQVVNLSPVPWGLEERYKYRMVINDGTGDKFYWINSFFGDPPGQDGQYPSSLDYRSINLAANNGSQWDWGWKLDRNYLTQGSVADFWVTMNAVEAKYNQNYKKQ